MLSIFLFFFVLHLGIIFLVMHMNKTDASYAPGLPCHSRQTCESMNTPQML